MRSRAPHLLLATAAVTLAFGVPTDALADGKPGDVLDPTLGQVAPADAAAKILRASEQPVGIARRGSRRARKDRAAKRR